MTKVVSSLQGEEKERDLLTSIEEIWCVEMFCCLGQDSTVTSWMGNSVVLVGDNPAARDVNWLRRLRWCGFVVTVVYSYAVALLPVKLTH